MEIFNCCGLETRSMYDEREVEEYILSLENYLYDLHIILNLTSFMNITKNRKIYFEKKVNEIKNVQKNLNLHTQLKLIKNIWNQLKICYDSLTSIKKLIKNNNLKKIMDYYLKSNKKYFEEENSKTYNNKISLGKYEFLIEKDDNENKYNFKNNKKNNKNKLSNLSRSWSNKLLKDKKINNIQIFNIIMNNK